MSDDELRQWVTSERSVTVNPWAATHRPEDTVVCVTGATGFVGGHVISQLLEQGYVVRGSVRSLANQAKRAHLDVMAQTYEGRLQLFEADLLIAGSFDEGIRGVDVVIHTAAAVTFAAKDPQREIVDVAVEGTRNLLRSIEQTSSVKRLVNTSSVAAVLSTGRKKPLFSEVDFCDSIGLKIDPYGVAKTKSELAVWEFSRQQDTCGASERVDVSNLLPGVIFGPVLAKHHVGGTASMLQMQLERKFPGVPRIKLWPVDVRDVAKALILAFQRDETQGTRTIFVDEGMWLGDVAEVLAAKYKVRTNGLPKLLGYLGAILDPSISVSYLRAMWGYDYGFEVGEAAARVHERFGMRCRSSRETVLDTAAFLVSKGWAKATEK